MSSLQKVRSFAIFLKTLSFDFVNIFYVNMHDKRVKARLHEVPIGQREQEAEITQSVLRLLSHLTAANLVEVGHLFYSWLKDQLKLINPWNC